MCHHNRIFNIVNIITHSYTAYYIILLTPLSLIETNYKNRTTMTNIWRTKNMFLLVFTKVFIELYITYTMMTQPTTSTLIFISIAKMVC